jgi:DNA helicase II / ATP-dependent DNA helicase PcrA
MSLAVDSLGVGLVRVATVDRYRLSAEDLSLALKALQDGDGSAVDKLSSVVGLSTLSSEGRASLTRLATDLDGLGLSTSPWEFLTSWLMDRTRHLAEIADAPQLAGKLRGIAVWQLVNFVRDQGKALRWPPIRRLLDRIRQLVLFADERDLRQVPAAAMHFDAVRLVTVHGSKGLEFQAVHLPGLNVRSFPSGWQGVRCPPPVGLSGADEDVEAAIKADHGLEEECLFFVAMSRARRHLTLTLFRKKNGRNSSESPYLKRLAGVADRIDRPALAAFPTLRKEGVVEVRWPEGWRVTSDLLSSYDSCPRRFFYTHVVGLKAAAKVTAFDRTHRCLSQLVDWLIDARAKGEVAEATVLAEFERIWKDRGPTDHAYANEYRDLASQLIQSLVSTGQGRQFQASAPIALDLSTGTVWVQPDEVSVLPNGTLTLRRVRTGRKRSEEYSRLEYVLYENAGRAQYLGGFTLEAVHLADGIAETVVVPPARVQSGREASTHMLGALRAGVFLADPDPFRCSRCPHFFICDATPEGVFEPPVQETSGL